MNKYIVWAAIVLLVACEGKKESKAPSQAPASSEPAVIPVKQLHYTIVNRFPHDEKAFTEGFLFHEGQLYESTGSPDNLPQTQSLIGIVDLKTGQLNKKVELDRAVYFGEGISILNNKIYQLTYKNKQGFIYDVKSFKKLGQFTYENEEGWGMTTDGASLIMSDGTSKLTYLDPFTMKPLKSLTITDNGAEVGHLNELEFVKGFIYANVWLTNYLMKIDPQNGRVVAKLDLSGLMNEVKVTHPGASEMNGIAFHATNNHLYVTGKMWPTIYELEVVE